MASTWIWRGNNEHVARVSFESKETSAATKNTVNASEDKLTKGGSVAAVESSSVKLTLVGSVATDDSIIVCGASNALDGDRYGGSWILNREAFTVAHMSDEEKRRHLIRAGLIASKPIVSERIFRVSIVNLVVERLMRIVPNKRLNVLSLDGSSRSSELQSRSQETRARTESGTVTKNGNSNDAEQWWHDDPMLRRVTRTAVQALYTLGLDIGEVDIALGGDGRINVLDVWPMLRDSELEALALRRFAAWYTTARDETIDRTLLIGADPEFVLVTPSGKVASASRFFGDGVGGTAGADAMIIGRRLVYPIAELRPEPAADPAALATNVRRLLLRAAARISDPALRWAAGAMPVPGLALGGHIHLSGAPLSTRLLRLLDSCVAFPLALVEDPAGRGRRPRYGKLGDFRLQPHGGFEYRTLPSWLVSPAAAKAAFALALLCAREAWTLPYTPAMQERYVEAYYAGDRSELAGCLDHVAASLAATESYAELACYIEPLLEAARRGKVWNERTDFRAKWRIPY